MHCCTISPELTGVHTAYGHLRCQSLRSLRPKNLRGVTAFMRWIVLSLACHKLFVAALDILPTWHTFPAGDSTTGSLVSMPLIPRDIPRCAGYLSMPRHLTQSYLHAGCNSAARPSCQSVDASERKHKLIGHDTNQFTCNICGVITEDSTFMRIFFLRATARECFFCMK